ncbi:Carboxylesterase protein [Dioscorea alata]|uniref:Carboxylesterase protein n=1 Tax=Dioscorea alata TaxID=55571 RepID=A0ACB7VY51_DIOAL|nr:Carboxylesterase protein [Dioscorea alata]
MTAPSMDSTSEDHELDFQIFDYLRVYKSGRVERLRGTETAPAGEDSATGVSSKDIIIDVETNVSARIYFPKLFSNKPEKLPVLVYFHGGGFCIQTAYSPIYHSYLNLLSSEAKMIIVSIEYRLAPEFPLPAAYDDCWKALQWVVYQLDGGSAVPEPWLVNFGDSSRLFLAGDSAGANIAHHMAMRAGAEGSEGVKIKGMVLMHPYFWGSKMEEEEVGDELRKRLDELWMLVCPASAGVDDPMINPLAETAPDLGRMACEKIMVCVAEKDLLSVRGMAYYEKLKEKWVDGVELVVSHGMDHVFHLDEPGCDQAAVLTNKVVAFLSS